jgi:L-alanine-DL-glutamate epimerase-like enolase superfamily enzyme
MMSRRTFVSAAAATLAMPLSGRLRGERGPLTASAVADRYDRIDAAAARPVLDVSAVREPVILEAIDFLRHGEFYLVRVQAKNGATGVAVSNERDMGPLIPMAKALLVPPLLGQDARRWEDLIEEVYVHASNYKRQGLLFWLPFASIEFAVLELLAQVAGKSVTTLLGGTPGRYVDLYHAHDDRTRTAAESVERMLATRDRHQTRAAKFKVGGRMRRNEEPVAGRSEQIIALAREKFGAEFTLYADANGSYDVENGLRIGRRCAEYGIAIFEEPVPHDMYEETQRIADAVPVAIAGGEQESSHNRFRWMIAHRAVDVVQPDLFYYGGFVRAIRVARMAHAVGLTCDTHLSGNGLGFLYMLHFVACIPNAGPYQEYKSFHGRIPIDAPAHTLAAHQGRLLCPEGAGFGVRIDPAWLAQAAVV